MNGPDRSASLRVGVVRSALNFWSSIASREGCRAATCRVLAAIAEFLRDSTPERHRQRYGDVDYDWEHRVNTTSATVSCRDRLLGVFHSPYQPTEPALFHEMLHVLREQIGSDLCQFTFIDLGSGKGRTLLMASDYFFRRIIGVELLPALHQAAQENICLYKSESQQCFAIESICADATQFRFPAEPIVLYLFNPFPIAGLRHVMTNLEQSLHTAQRPFYLLYHNTILEDVLSESAAFRKIRGTHQYALYQAR